MSTECANLRSEIDAAPPGVPWAPSLREKVRTHLDTCDKCRAELLVEAAIADGWAAKAPDLVVDDQRVIDRIQATLRDRADRRNRLQPLYRLWPWGLPVAIAACLGFFFLRNSMTAEYNILGDTRAIFVPGREKLGGPDTRPDGFEVSIGVKHPAFVILAVRNERGLIEEIQDGSHEHVAFRWEPTQVAQTVGPYAIRDSTGSNRTHVFVLGCDKDVSDSAWFARPQQSVPTGPDLLRTLERVRKEVADYFHCEVSLTPIPQGE
jgi:hypothetical protein